MFLLWMEHPFVLSGKTPAIPTLNEGQARFDCLRPRV
jgi:hypothetical protein